MIKLSAGISRKVGEPDYGSRGASVHLEIELESHLAAEPPELLNRIRGIFQMARNAVNEELGVSRPRITGAAIPGGGGQLQTVQTSVPRMATESQLRAIRSMSGRLAIDADGFARSTFGVTLDSLTLSRASQLIDQLKDRLSHPRNGDTAEQT